MSTPIQTPMKAEDHPQFPKNADLYSQSAWRIGYEQGHGLRPAPKGILKGFESRYREGLQVAAKDKALAKHDRAWQKNFIQPIAQEMVKRKVGYLLITIRDDGKASYVLEPKESALHNVPSVPSSDEKTPPKKIDE